MKKKNLIAVNAFCTFHQVEFSFISSLQQSGLIEVTTIEGTEFIDAGQLSHLEKIMRLHYDLDINFEGIETITHLLQRIQTMQEKITSLRNRLHLYESND